MPTGSDAFAPDNMPNGSDAFVSPTMPNGSDAFVSPTMPIKSGPPTSAPVATSPPVARDIPEVAAKGGDPFLDKRIQELQTNQRNPALLAQLDRLRQKQNQRLAGTAVNSAPAVPRRQAGGTTVYGTTRTQSAASPAVTQQAPVQAQPGSAVRAPRTLTPLEPTAKAPNLLPEQVQIATDYRPKVRRAAIAQNPNTPESQKLRREQALVDQQHQRYLQNEYQQSLQFDRNLQNQRALGEYTYRQQLAREQAPDSNFLTRERADRSEGLRALGLSSNYAQANPAMPSYVHY